MDQCDQHGLFFFHDVMPHAVADDTVTFADTAPTFDAYAFEVGDDNADGIITEDESGWDCLPMGNRICVVPALCCRRFARDPGRLHRRAS